MTSQSTQKTHEEIWEMVKAYELRRYMAHDYDDEYKKLDDSTWSAVYEYLDWKYNGTMPVKVLS